MSQISKQDSILVMGDINVKIGSDNKDTEEVTINNNCEKIVELCVIKELLIGSSLLSHRKIHKANWMSPDRMIWNYICVNKKSRSFPMGVMVLKGAFTSRLPVSLNAAKECIIIRRNEN